MAADRDAAAIWQLVGTKPATGYLGDGPGRRSTRGRHVCVESGKALDRQTVKGPSIVRTNSNIWNLVPVAHLNPQGIAVVEAITTT